MKKLPLSPLLFGVLVLALSSCKKKSESLELVAEPVETLSREKFPNLSNLSKLEMDSLIKLLKNGDKTNEKAIAYANVLAKKASRVKTQLALNKRSSINSLDNFENVDETESTTSENLSSGMYSAPVITTYAGDVLDSDFDGVSIVPSFKEIVKAGVTLSGRNTILDVEIPIHYVIAWAPYTGETYYKVKNMTNAKPKLHISGVLGTLTVETEESNFSLLGDFGDYIGTADVLTRENRALVTTSTGDIRIQANGAAVGGTLSNGQTIVQTRDIQGYFGYHGDILFFGHNTGYNRTRYEHDSGYGVPMWQLLDPIIGSSHTFRFTGINQN